MQTTTSIIRQVMEWALDHLDADLSVEMLSRRAGYSGPHFSRAFTAETGEGPASWVLSQRVARAAQSLSAGEKRILDIALECGFNDVTTFTRAFRRRTGMAPSTFRRVHKGGPATSSGVIVGKRVCMPGFSLCGLTTDIADDPTAPAALWQRLFRLLADKNLEIDDDAFRQVAFWRRDPESRFTCIAGFVRTNQPVLSLPFVTVEVPGAICRRFIVDTRSDCYATAYDTIFNVLLPAMRDRPSAQFVCERQRSGAGEGIEVWVPVSDLPADGG